MNDPKPNVTGYLEPVLRLAVATFLVPLILYSEWMVFVPVPYYILVTIMVGHDPLKAWLVRQLAGRSTRSGRAKSSVVTHPEALAKPGRAARHQKGVNQTSYGH